MEGLVHVLELAKRHVEIPEQVVQVSDDVMVKAVGHRPGAAPISLSLKQANETATATNVEEFDPTLYSMAATYDDQGDSVFPTGSTRTPASGSRARRAACGLGGAVPQGARPLGGPRQAADGGQEGRDQWATAEPTRTRPAAPTRASRTTAARWPPTRRCRRCAELTGGDG